MTEHQLEMFHEYAFSIELSTQPPYKYDLLLNGQIICKFISLDIALATIKQTLKKAQFPYARIMDIVRGVLKDYKEKELPQ